MGLYAQYAVAKLPGAFGDPQSVSWATALGLLLDGEIQRATFAVQARYTPLAPTDALPDGLADLSMAPTYNDAAPTWQPGPHVVTQGDLVGDPNGYIWNATTGGVAGTTMPAWTNPPSTGDTAADGAAIWTYQGTPSLPKTRAWMLSAFSSWASTTTQNPWFPLTPYTASQTIGDNGNVWSCTVAGTTGTRPPFPPNPTFGQTVVEATGPAWAFNGAAISDTPVPALPPDALAPGFYLAGTPLGLIAALVNSGFYADTTGLTPSAGDWSAGTAYSRFDTVADGSGNVWQCLVPGTSGATSPFGPSPTLLELVSESMAGPVWCFASLPRLYVNRDFVNAPAVSVGGGTAQIVGASATDLSIPISILNDGGSLEVGTGAPVWAANTAYAAGDFVTDSNSHVWQCASGGTSGRSAPAWPASPVGPEVVYDAFVPAAWVASTGYSVGQYVSRVGNTYQCITAGTSGSTGPTGTSISPPGAPIVDGTARWTFVPSIPPVVWNAAEFTPIPASVPLGSGSAAIILSGAFDATDGPVTLQYVNQQPDLNGSAWARLWLVLPVGNLLAPPLPWSYDTGAAGWLANNIYSVGQYCINGGNIYQCSVGGESAGSGGPTGTGSSPIVDNDATWLFAWTPDNWQASHAYAAGSIVADDLGHGWVCTTAGTTGGSEPSWPTTPTAGVTPQADGGVTWTCAWDGTAYWYWNGNVTVNGVTSLVLPSWGATPLTDSTTGGPDIYGLVSSLIVQWNAGPVLPVGFWAVFGNDTELDTPYTATPPVAWNESQATINSQPVVFARLSAESE